MSYSRRDFLSKSAVGAGTFMVSASTIAQAAGNAMSSNQKPNIVFILVDDLGYYGIGANGATSIQNNPIHTPNIDQLSNEGVRFTHCHSRAMCGPSRQVLLTGKDRFRWSNYPSLDWEFFPERMQQAGYSTGISGKWMLGPLIKPEKRGFDEALIHCGSYEFWDPAMMVFNSNGYMKEFNQPASVEEAEGGDFNVCQTESFTPGCATKMTGKFGPDMLCDFSIDFINRHKHHPFFLYYPMKMTHTIYPDLPGRPGVKTSYAEAIGYMDKLVGRVVDAIDQAGIRDNTMIIFAGDNGHTCHKPEADSGHPCLAGGKGGVKDGATRVPLIVSWKGSAPEGKVVEDLVDFTDFYGTMVEASGATLPTEEVFDGRSFLPQIRGNKGNPRDWIYIHGGYHPKPTLEELQDHYTELPDVIRYVVGNRYKLYGDGRYYDLESDPWEGQAIPLGEGSKQAEDARKFLQSVLNTYDDRSQWATDEEFIEPTLMEKVRTGTVSLTTPFPGLQGKSMGSFDIKGRTSRRNFLQPIFRCRE